MSTYHVFSPYQRSTPKSVTFGGVPCLAIETLWEKSPGVCIKVYENRWALHQVNAEVELGTLRRLGALNCDTCHRQFYFHADDGHVYTFPFEMSGWMFWNPSPLVAGAEVQTITVRAACPQCRKTTEGLAAQLMEGF